MVSRRKNYVNTDINANERAELNTEIDTLYTNDVELEAFYIELLEFFTKFQSRYSVDVANMKAEVIKGDSAVKGFVESMLRDFLVAKPSNLDEVVAARLGKATLRDIMLELKNKLDATDKYQKVKLTDDLGAAVSVTDVSELAGKSGFFKYSNGAKGMPTGSIEGIGLHTAYNKTDICMAIAMDNKTKRLFLRVEHRGAVTQDWKAIAFDGAYDDIRKEVEVAKGNHPSLEAAIVAANPIVSSSYYGATGDGTDQTEALQRALDAAQNKKLDIPYGKGIYKVSSTLYIPDGCEINIHPRAKFVWSGLPGMFMCVNKNNIPTTGGYDKSKSIAVKGGIFDMQNSGAYAFGFSHMTDLEIDTKIINVKDKNGVLLNAVKDYNIRVQAEGFSSATEFNYVVGLTVATAETDFNNPVVKPFDKTPCLNGRVFIYAKNIKRGLGENKVITGIKHSKLVFNCDISQCEEHVLYSTNIEWFKTENAEFEDVGNGLYFMIENDTIEQFELNGVKARRGRGIPSRAIWFRSKEGDTAPQFKNVTMNRPDIDDFGAGIITDYGGRTRINNPTVTGCWEDGIWGYMTLDWKCDGAYARGNNRRGWPRADIHIGEGGKTTFRAILTNCQARTILVTNIQDSIIADNIVGPQGIEIAGSSFNCTIDRNLKVGW
ncbi:hypothetical protein PDK30_25835 [Bacillus cereus]|nr:hypothetical protein [Bacillus cereus]